MLRVGDVIDLGRFGQKFVVKSLPGTHEAGAGGALELEMHVLPQSDGPPVHIHPYASESYECLQGVLEVCVDGAWKRIRQGELIEVDPGVAHTFRNPSSETALVRNIHLPAMGFPQFFEDLAKAVKLTDPSKRSFKDILYLAKVWTKYPNEIRSVRPPHVILQFFSLIAGMLGIQF